MIIGDLYRRNARHNPDGVAVICGDRRVTNAQLLLGIERTIRRLMALGLKRQDRFAILAKNSVEYIELYGAAETAGYVAAAVNYRLSAEEMTYIINDCAPKVLIFEEEFVGLVDLFRPKIPAGIQLVCIGQELPWARAYHALPMAEGKLPQARSDDLAYLIYTSGTSGRPKGAMLDQRGQFEFGRVVAEESALIEQDVVLIVMPLYHVGAKCNQLAALFRGGTLVVVREYSREKVSATLEQHGVTVAHLAPLMVSDLVAVAASRSFDYSRLRLVHYASGPMAEAQLRKAVSAFGPIFMQVYGMTEAGVITVLHSSQHVLEGPEDVVRRLASAGVPPPSAAIKIVDDGGDECAVGVNGDILAWTPSLLRGYWNNSVATAEAFNGRWLRTGDIGFCDDKGFLFIIDRKKEVIISGGENIYPREVEEALQFHPEVAEAAVIGIPDEKWGEAVMAFVVTVSGSTVTEQQLIDFCRTKIASYKKPKGVKFVDKLPRLANHKIDKKVLREPFWHGRSRRV